MCGVEHLSSALGSTCALQIDETPRQAHSTLCHRANTCISILSTLRMYVPFKVVQLLHHIAQFGSNCISAGTEHRQPTSNSNNMYVCAMS